MVETVLKMVRARLNRMYAGGQYATTDGFDEYVRARISAAMAELERMGITVTGSPDDVMLLADYVCWQYSNRDKGDDDPAWLRRRLRNRWIAEPRDGEAAV